MCVERPLLLNALAHKRLETIYDELGVVTRDLVGQGGDAPWILGEKEEEGGRKYV